MEDLWAKITQMPRPHKVVDFPRKGPDGKSVGELAMWVLTQEEQMQCAANTERFTRKILKEVPKGDEARRGYEDLYNNAGACEILFCACRKRDRVEEAFFPSVEALRKLSVDEIGTLMMHYYTTQVELGPIVSRLSEEEMEAWVKRIIESGTRYPLDLLSWEALKDLAYTMAFRIALLQTDKSSPGSQPEEVPKSPTETPEPEEATP